MWHFVHEIFNINFMHAFYMASFDVKSLFANLLLIEIIKLCVEQYELDKLISHNFSASL